MPPAVKEKIKMQIKRVKGKGTEEHLRFWGFADDAKIITTQTCASPTHHIFSKRR